MAPGCPELAAFADRAAGDDDSYEDVSDDELIGVLCAWDRVEAHAWARKSAAIAELIRRRPEPGCELPPADVLAADQRITAWARQLKAAGLEGSMDELRARAYLDILLGKDSRPDQGIRARDGEPGADDGGQDGPDTGEKGGPEGGGKEGGATGPAGPDGRAGPSDTAPAPCGPQAGVIPAGFAGRSCLCNGGPKCRRDHRLKQHPRWQVDQLPDSTFRWTTPSGRQYTTEPTRYPI